MKLLLIACHNITSHFTTRCYISSHVQLLVLYFIICLDIASPDNIFKYMSWDYAFHKMSCPSITWHYSYLHFIGYHYMTLHFITYNYITWHYISSHYSHHMSWHYISSRANTLHNILNFITCHDIPKCQWMID